MNSVSSISSIFAIAAAITGAIIGIVVWFGDRKNRSRISFLWVSIFIGTWIATNVLFAIDVGQYEYPVALVSYMAAMLIVVQLFEFSLGLVRKHSAKGRSLVIIVLGYAIAIVSAVPGVIATGVKTQSIQTHVIALAVYGLVLLAYIIASCSILIVGRHHSSGVLKRQIGLVLRGIVTAGIIGVFCNLLLPIINIYAFTQLGPAGAVALVAAVAYSIVKYSLFDIRSVIVRTAAYVIALFSLAAVYFIVTYLLFGSLFGKNTDALQRILSGVFAFGLGFLFPGVKRFFDRLTNRIFYRDMYNSEELFARLNKTLGSTTDLYRLLEVVSKEISNILNAQQGFFFIHSDPLHYVTAGTPKHSKVPIDDIRILDRYIHESGNHVIVTSTLDASMPIYRIMVSHKLGLVLPLVQNDSVIGYFILGEHLASNYTSRDVKALSAITNELIIAIENALSVQEVRELNDSLQQRVDDATKELRSSNAQLHRLDKAKDDFISMASHQLRTPLTSVKGYISMVREGDAGKITRLQDRLLGEAFTSSERMVHLINDFLNVSRLQTGKFLIDTHPVDLAKVIGQELDSLTTNAQSRHLSFSYKSPKVFPLLNLDEDKIRQVIMNFSDNAIYYSTEGSKIKVTLALNSKNAVFTVTDTGIGVPRTEQSQLFNKFYRASNARKQRPDGTGVGLYLAKTVIEAHGGKVVFESVEGKGSTFGFRLPLDELRTRGDVDNLKNQDNKN